MRERPLSIYSLQATTKKLTEITGSFTTAQALVPYASYISAFCLDRRDIAVDSLKNLCDVFIPLTSEGHLNINAGVIGLLGVMSSIAGIAALIDPSARLAP